MVKCLRYIGIAAYSGEPPAKLVEAAREFIKLLSSRVNPKEVAVIVGGYWGLMRVIVDEALTYGFNVLIIPPLEQERIRFPEGAIVVRTGTSFRVRSVFLVRSSEVLVIMGGGAGSMQEAVTAYTEGVPTVLLTGFDMPSDKLAALAPYLDERRLAEVKVVRNPGEAVNYVVSILSGGKVSVNGELRTRG